MPESEQECKRARPERERGAWVAHLDVGAGLGLGDGQTDALPSGHHVREDLVLKLLRSKVVDRGRPAAAPRSESRQPSSLTIARNATQLDSHLPASTQSLRQPQTPAPIEFVIQNIVMEPVPLLDRDPAKDGPVRLGPLLGDLRAKVETDEDAGFAEELVDLGVDLLGLLPVEGLPVRVLVEEGTRGLRSAEAQSGVSHQTKRA